MADWTHRADHIAKRNVTPAEANEALDDPNGVWMDPDPGSDSGISIRVIGDAPSRNEVLVVIIVPKDTTDRNADYWGASAWPANNTHKRIYREAQE